MSASPALGLGQHDHHYPTHRLIVDHLGNRRDKLGAWNAGQGATAWGLVNSHRLTNIGTFNAHEAAYLRANERISR